MRMVRAANLLEVSMATTAVNITLRNIHCSDEGDGPGSAEPYLWTVFFKVDGDTVSAESGTLQGTATVLATPGNHGDLGEPGSDVDPGENVPIPAALGQFTGFVKSIPAAGGTALPGVIGYVATLLEEDSTPGHAIATGHLTLNQAVQSELNALIPTLKLADLTNLDPVLDALKQRIAAQVKAAMRRSLSTLEKLTTLNNDDTIGTDVKAIFAQGERIGTDPFSLSADPIALERRFKSEGDWTLSGQAAVIASRHVFLRIIGRSIPGVPVPVVGTGPLPGVSVQLFELDRPAPAGDDPVVPAVGETDVIVGRKEITETRTYDPAPDQNFGTLTTDLAGVVAFQVFPNKRAGVFTRTRTEEDLHSHETETTVTHATITEARPDYGVTVVGTSGKLLATRQLVALNAPGDVGTAVNPVDVFVDRDEPVVVVT
jgi:hypothetical protein